MAKKKIKSKLAFNAKLNIVLFVIVIFIFAISFYAASIMNANRDQSFIEQSQPHTLPISKHQPNKLVVTRQEDTTFHLTALSITVSNPTLVKKIFNDILQLPIFDAPGTMPFKCPEGLWDAPVYTLTFYQNNKLRDTAILTTTGCRTVIIDNYPARLDNGSLSSFDTDFQQATGLSGQSLYGYQ